MVRMIKRGSVKLKRSFRRKVGYHLNDVKLNYTGACNLYNAVTGNSATTSPVTSSTTPTTTAATTRRSYTTQVTETRG